MSILWIALGVAFVIGLLKATWKLLKFLCLAGLIAAALLFLSSIGLFGV